MATSLIVADTITDVRNSTHPWINAIGLESIRFVRLRLPQIGSMFPAAYPPGLYLIYC